MMNAKEYKQIEIAFIAKYAHHWIATEFQKDLKEVSIAYHQVKSEEEADKRMELVEGWWENNVDGDMNITVKKVVNLAAFGKEGEG